MYDAILFDLDDTLLRNEMEPFVQAYYKNLIPKLAPHFNGFDVFETVQKSTYSMLDSKNSDVTLRQVFKQKFDEITDLSFEDMEPHFIDFYQNEYKNIQKVTSEIDLALDAVTLARKKFDKVVVATIPIFPEIAIRERLKWAGLDHLDFDLVTSFEIMHASKPHPDYYAEIAQKIDCAPERCLMIGNDHVDDLPAKATGMTTFLVTDFERNEKSGQFQPDYQGSMRDLLLFLEKTQR